MTGGRQARVERKTKETEIGIQLGLDGTGASKVKTPIHTTSRKCQNIERHMTRRRFSTIKPCCFN